ncbi:MAG: hypothetical protein IJA34_14430 [Lachnospiraceae bacterium]|nr:hypothetical protein [Lachnospiraceae bacterium]
MKKFKCITVMSMIFISSVFMFTGCKKNLLMDEHKCAEVALEYMENKYQEEFEVIYSGEKGKFIGKAGYAEVTLSNKNESTENEYVVVVYPDGSDDKEDDGYYDSYKVISDTYMCYLLKDSVKSEMEKLLMEAGLTDFIISTSIKEFGGIVGFSGFANDFPIQNQEIFSLTDIINNHKISIHCWIKIPEFEDDEMLQYRITEIIKPLISLDDIITFSIDVYDKEIYEEIKELKKNNIGYSARGNKRISFSIEED